VDPKGSGKTPIDS